VARLLFICIVVLISPLGFHAGIAIAAPEDYQGKPIRAIEFEPAKQPYSRDYLDKLLPLELSEPLELANVRTAIERLYATGRYSGVTVDARLAQAGVVLKFITRQNYFVGHVSVERISDPPNEGVLVNSTRLELGTLYTDEALAQAVRNLENVLQSNGFYNSRVQPVFEHDEATQQVRIHFQIDSGDRARYTMPEIKGDLGRSEKEIAGDTRWKGWLGWKKVTESRTQAGVQRVRRSYQKRDQLEARVSLESLQYEKDTGRVRPSLAVESGPKIQIGLTGAKISRGKLRQLVPVYEEQSVDRDLLAEGRQNLIEYFESQGYFDAKVAFQSKGLNGSKEEVIEYTVDRGQRHNVAKIIIEGNKYFDTDTIRERMYVRPASTLQFRHGRYSESLMREDVDSIVSLYQSNGFRDVGVNPRVERGYGGKERNMAVFVTIKEGPQWLVGKMDLEGVPEESRETVEGLLQSLPGQPFSELNVAIDRDNVLDWYYNQGYPDAQFQWTITPSAEPNRMDIEYTVHEGERKFVRNVLVSGLNATDPGLVAERLRLQPGDPLSRADMLETQRRLYDLGIFARVDMALQNPQGDETQKTVLLDMEEARKYTVTSGLGAEITKIGGCGTCLDPVGHTGFSPRAYFGVTRRNFRGTGHIISFQSRASILQQRAVVSYQAPQFRSNPNLNLLFSALYDDSRDVNTFTARRREGSVQVGQKISKASTLLYRFSYRRVSVTDLNLGKISSEDLLPFYLQPARVGMVSVNFIQDRRDDPTDTHRGIFNTLDLGWAPESRFLGSATAFTRFLGHNATYHPFGLGNRFVFARALKFGWEQRLSGAPDLPLPEKFFAGGAQSHRGFPENQAGPRDPETGFPLGGNALLMNQMEFRYPLLGENLRGVLFADSGNVYSGLDKLSLRFRQRGVAEGKYDFNYMVHSVGIGFRYRTPIGPVRIDFSYAINPPTFFGYKGTEAELQAGTGRLTVQRISHFQFHFSLGQAF
jgi:outer membrane protein insertion porin family